jgi:hypothetical protein
VIVVSDGNPEPRRRSDPVRRDDGDEGSEDHPGAERAEHRSIGGKSPSDAEHPEHDAVAVGSAGSNPFA